MLLAVMRQPLRAKQHAQVEHNILQEAVDPPAPPGMNEPPDADDPPDTDDPPDLTGSLGAPTHRFPPSTRQPPDYYRPSF